MTHINFDTQDVEVVIDDGVTISADITEEQKIDVYWQDEVNLDVDLSLLYIKSGEQEIKNYVDNVSKPEINQYIENYAEPIITSIVNKVATPTVENYINTVTKPELDNYSSEKISQFNENAEEKTAYIDEQVAIVTDLSTSALSSSESAKNSENNAKVSENNSKASETSSSQTLAEINTIYNNFKQETSDVAFQSKDNTFTGTNTFEKNITTPNPPKDDKSNTVATTVWVSDRISELDTSVIKDKITNCITEIPQDIKLELNDGVLTLKAGSKVYVPNGKNADDTPRFDEVITENDIKFTYADGNTYVAYLKDSGKNMGVNTLSTCISGETDTGSAWHLWYDTKSNKINRYNGTTLSEANCSFPICIYSGETKITSIQQVFNGFGYIGSTVFALPNVKCLIPNGRNADGTLNNIEYTINKVLVKDASTRQQDDYFFIDTNNWFSNWSKLYYFIDNYPTPRTSKWYLVYDTQKNRFYISDDGGDYYIKQICILGEYGKGLSYFSTKLPITLPNLNGDNVFKGKIISDGSNHYGTQGFDANLECISYLNHYEDVTDFTSSRVLMVKDNAKNPIGYIRHFKYMGYSGIDFEAIRNVNGENKYARIALGVNNEGKRYTLCDDTDNIGSIISTKGITKSANGYLKMGNGIIIQWGEVAGTATTITFPIAFSNTNYQICCNTIVPSQNTARTSHSILWNKSTTSIAVRIGQYNMGATTDSNYTHHWIAIGY